MPNYQRRIVYLSDEQRQELFENRTITVNGVTIDYSDNDMYVTPQETPYIKPQSGIPASDLASGVIPDISSMKGRPNGLAELDSEGRVPSTQLPSYVDTISEYSSFSAFPVSGESGKIYVALDTNKSYRWSGSSYVEISSSLALGETAQTAYRGDRGKIAYDHASDASKLTTAQTSGFYKIATTAEGHVASVSAVTKADITAFGIPDTGNLRDVIAIQDGTPSSTYTEIWLPATAPSSIQVPTYAEFEALASDVSDKYEKPSGGIPASDLASGVIPNISSMKGTANGLAELDANGKVPSSQLPSFVDDVEEYASSSNFPVAGESGKIYIATDTNITYRWSGSAYTAIGSDIALGETSSTAYRGDRGKVAYDHATDASRLTTAQTSGLYKFATTAEGHIASATNVAKSDLTALGVADATDTVLNTTLSRGRLSGSTVGANSFAFGEDVTASNSNTHAEGYTTIASNANAHAEGSLTTASGANSHAEGYGGTFTLFGTSYTSQAAGTADHTEGYLCATASRQPGNHAEGYCTVASGGAAHSEGCNTIADGTVSHAEGFQTKAINAYSHAEGYTTEASGYCSHAEGYYAIASGTESHAEGANTIAAGSYSHVSGLNNVADSYSGWPEWAASTSYAVGDKVKRTTTSGNTTTVSGYICKTANSDSSFTSSKWTAQSGKMNFAEIVGNGTGTTNALRSNARALDWDGNMYLKGDLFLKCNADSTGGGRVLSEATRELSIGRKTNTTVGNYSMAIGHEVTASGYSSFAEGDSTTASGNYSHAEGYGTSVSGNYSHAEGYYTTVSNYGAHAEGYGTYATEYCTHAEGYETYASGGMSHAEGSETAAYGTGAHAEGYYSYASGYAAHAEGYNTTASGDYSHAEGYATSAVGSKQHTFGNCNKADSYANWPEWTANTTYAVGDKVKRTDGSGSSVTITGYICKTANSDSAFISSKWTNQYGRMNYIEIVGNGTGTTIALRSNARALDWEGNEYLMGDLYVGCGADSTGGSKVLTSADITGIMNGYAELDANGKVPSSQLPSYVDDVEEYSSSSNFPVTGESGKIYIATDTNITYRWSGSDYAPIGSDLALGETSSTAYRGDRGKTAYDHAIDGSRLTTAQNSGLYKFATTSEGHVASVTAVQKSDITGLGIVDIPAAPSTNGTYILKCVVANGTPTYSWLEISSASGVSF